MCPTETKSAKHKAHRHVWRVVGILHEVWVEASDPEHAF